MRAIIQIVIVDRSILRRVGLGAGLGLIVLFGLSIPVLGLKGDDTYLSIVMMTAGAVMFGCSIPRVRRTHPPEARGFAVIHPADAPSDLPSAPRR